LKDNDPGTGEFGATTKLMEANGMINYSAGRKSR